MTVVRARVLGYCMGVRRAVAAAQKALAQPADGRIYTLGPLIHNPVVQDALADRGAEVLRADALNDVRTGDVVLIRAHGTTPAVLAALRQQGASVRDATCPRVHLSQRRANEWSARGYTVIIAGDRNHGEVVSIAGYADGNAVVVQDRREAAALDVPAHAVLIAQTTFGPEEFEAITEIILQKNPSVQVFRSICSATRERQESLRALAGTVDGILVIGGRSSANTRRLYETARALCATAALIEGAHEIPAAFFALRSVGLTAGASTPEETIADVERALREGPAPRV